jgi:hypothetical protein
VYHRDGVLRGLKTFVVLGIAAVVLTAPAAAKGPGAQTTPQGIGGYLAQPLPTVAAQLAKNVAKASFAHKYNAVWSYLHPSYQKAISQSHWQNCQGSHPAAPPSVKVTRVAVATFNKLPTSLPLLGKQSVEEIQLQIQFQRPGQSTQYALAYTFWLKQGKKWEAVWLPEEYQAYKSGKCYVTPQGPPLY